MLRNIMENLFGTPFICVVKKYINNDQQVCTKNLQIRNLSRSIAVSVLHQSFLVLNALQLPDSSPVFVEHRSALSPDLPGFQLHAVISTQS